MAEGRVWLWRGAGLYQELSACKEVVTEPTNVSGEVFDEAIKTYRSALLPSRQRRCRRAFKQGVQGCCCSCGQRFRSWLSQPTTCVVVRFFGPI